MESRDVLTSTNRYFCDSRTLSCCDGDCAGYCCDFAISSYEAFSDCARFCICDIGHHFQSMFSLNKVHGRFKRMWLLCVFSAALGEDRVGAFRLRKGCSVYEYVPPWKHGDRTSFLNEVQSANRMRG